MRKSFATAEQGRIRMPRINRESPHKNRSDTELIQLIAGRRDQQAFTELFRRYEKIGYQVAVNVTGDHHLAEDTLLDAMYNIWRSAHTFKPIGSTRSWIIRIIVRASMKGQNVKNRRRKREPKNLEQVAEPGRALEEGFGSDEMLVGLKRNLQRLPNLDRNILTLRFVGGLSQADIGKELSMSQRTVSERISQALSTLRLRLTQAGLSAALPLLSEDGLAKALCDGVEPPLGLAEKMERLIREDRQPIPVPFQVTKTHLILASLLALILTAGVARYMWKQNYSVANSRKETAAGGVELASTDSFVGESIRHWDFDKPQLDGLKLLTGSWQHLPDGAPDGSGCMNITSNTSLRIGVDLPASNLPVEIRLKIKLNGFAPGLSRGWASRTPAAIVQPSYSEYIFTDVWCNLRFLITPNQVSVWRGDTLLSLEMGRQKEKERFCLNLIQGWRIDDLEIGHGTLQSNLKAARYVEAVENIPLNERNGFRLLPQLLSAQGRKEDRGIYRVVFPGTPFGHKAKTQTWSFRNPGELSDFAVAKGSWLFLPNGGQENLGCVEIQEGLFNAYFDVKARGLPFLITARVRIPDIQLITQIPRLEWLSLRSGTKVTTYLFADVKFKSMRAWVTMRFYVTPRYIDVWVGKKRISLIIGTNSPFSSPRLDSSLRMQIDSLEVKSLKKDQLPGLGGHQNKIGNVAVP